MNILKQKSKLDKNRKPRSTEMLEKLKIKIQGTDSVIVKLYEFRIDLKKITGNLLAKLIETHQFMGMLSCHIITSS